MNSLEYESSDDEVEKVSEVPRRSAARRESSDSDEEEEEHDFSSVVKNLKKELSNENKNDQRLSYNANIAIYGIRREDPNDPRTRLQNPIFLIVNFPVPQEGTQNNESRKKAFTERVKEECPEFFHHFALLGTELLSGSEAPKEGSTRLYCNGVQYESMDDMVRGVECSLRLHSLPRERGLAIPSAEKYRYTDLSFTTGPYNGMERMMHNIRKSPLDEEVSFRPQDAPGVLFASVRKLLSLTTNVVNKGEDDKKAELTTLCNGEARNTYNAALCALWCAERFRLYNEMIEHSTSEEEVRHTTRSAGATDAAGNMAVLTSEYKDATQTGGKDVLPGYPCHFGPPAIQRCPVCSELSWRFLTPAELTAEKRNGGGGEHLRFCGLSFCKHIGPLTFSAQEELARMGRQEFFSVPHPHKTKRTLNGSASFDNAQHLFAVIQEKVSTEIPLEGIKPFFSTMTVSHDYVVPSRYVFSPSEFPLYSLIKKTPPGTLLEKATPPHDPYGMVLPLPLNQFGDPSSPDWNPARLKPYLFPKIQEVTDEMRDALGMMASRLHETMKSRGADDKRRNRMVSQAMKFLRPMVVTLSMYAQFAVEDPKVYGSFNYQLHAGDLDMNGDSGYPLSLAVIHATYRQMMLWTLNLYPEWSNTHPSDNPAQALAQFVVKKLSHGTDNDVESMTLQLRSDYEARGKAIVDTTPLPALTGDAHHASTPLFDEKFQDDLQTQLKNALDSSDTREKPRKVLEIWFHEMVAKYADERYHRLYLDDPAIMRYHSDLRHDRDQFLNKGKGPKSSSVFDLDDDVVFKHTRSVFWSLNADRSKDPLFVDEARNLNLGFREAVRLKTQMEHMQLGPPPGSQQSAELLQHTLSSLSLGNPLSLLHELSRGTTRDDVAGNLSREQLLSLMSVIDFDEAVSVQDQARNMIEPIKKQWEELFKNQDYMNNDGDDNNGKTFENSDLSLYFDTATNPRIMRFIILQGHRFLQIMSQSALRHRLLDVIMDSESIRSLQRSAVTEALAISGELGDAEETMLQGAVAIYIQEDKCLSQAIEQRINASNHERTRQVLRELKDKVDERIKASESLQKALPGKKSSSSTFLSLLSFGSNESPWPKFAQDSPPIKHALVRLGYSVVKTWMREDFEEKRLEAREKLSRGMATKFVDDSVEEEEEEDDPSKGSPVRDRVKLATRLGVLSHLAQQVPAHQVIQAATRMERESHNIPDGDLDAGILSVFEVRNSSTDTQDDAFMALLHMHLAEATISSTNAPDTNAVIATDPFGLRFKSRCNESINSELGKEKYALLSELAGACKQNDFAVDSEDEEEETGDSRDDDHDNSDQDDLDMVEKFEREQEDREVREAEERARGRMRVDNTYEPGVEPSQFSATSRNLCREAVDSYLNLQAEWNVAVAECAFLSYQGEGVEPFTGPPLHLPTQTYVPFEVPEEKDLLHVTNIPLPVAAVKSVISSAGGQIILSYSVNDPSKKEKDAPVRFLSQLQHAYPESVPFKLPEKRRVHEHEEKANDSHFRKNEFDQLSRTVGAVTKREAYEQIGQKNYKIISKDDMKSVIDPFLVFYQDLCQESKIDVIRKLLSNHKEVLRLMCARLDQEKIKASDAAIIDALIQFTQWKHIRDNPVLASLRRAYLQLKILALSPSLVMNMERKEEESSNTSLQGPVDNHIADARNNLDQSFRVDLTQARTHTDALKLAQRAFDGLDVKPAHLTASLGKQEIPLDLQYASLILDAIVGRDNQPTTVEQVDKDNKFSGGGAKYVSDSSCLNLRRAVGTLKKEVRITSNHSNNLLRAGAIITMSSDIKTQLANLCECAAQIASVSRVLSDASLSGQDVREYLNDQNHQIRPLTLRGASVDPFNLLKNAMQRFNASLKVILTSAVAGPYSTKDNPSKIVIPQKRYAQVIKNMANEARNLLAEMGTSANLKGATTYTKLSEKTNLMYRVNSLVSNAVFLDQVKPKEWAKMDDMSLDNDKRLEAIKAHLHKSKDLLNKIAAANGASKALEKEAPYYQGA